MACVCLAAVTGREAEAEQVFEDHDTVILGGMEKVTGHAFAFAVGVGETGSFGTLRVTVRACRKTPPWQTPESASFLEIRDRHSSEPDDVFTGWMFAGTPGVSALEHPVYDIWILDCIDRGGQWKSAPSMESARSRRSR